MTLINNTVLMSDALHFRAEQAINPYYTNHVVNTSIACREQASIATALTEAGVRVISVPAPADSQDGVYTANWALVSGDKAVLARLPNVRKSEETYAEKILGQLGKTVIRVPDNLKFSGQGDSLQCGNFLFCGSGYRSDEAAQSFAAEQLGLERIQLQTVPKRDANGDPVINAISGWPDSFFYDIDLALSIIKAPSDGARGLIAYCPEAFEPESQQKLNDFDEVEKIIVSLEEAKQAFACNLVSTGETVIMSAHAPNLRAELENRGLNVITPEVVELAKGGGYIRCTSLSID